MWTIDQRGNLASSHRVFLHAASNEHAAGLQKSQNCRVWSEDPQKIPAYPSYSSYVSGVLAKPLQSSHGPKACQALDPWWDSPRPWGHWTTKNNRNQQIIPKAPGNPLCQSSLSAEDHVCSSARPSHLLPLTEQNPPYLGPKASVAHQTNHYIYICAYIYIFTYKNTSRQHTHTLTCICILYAYANENKYNLDTYEYQHAYHDAPTLDDVGVLFMMLRINQHAAVICSNALDETFSPAIFCTILQQCPGPQSRPRPKAETCWTPRSYGSTARPRAAFNLFHFFHRHF